MKFAWFERLEEGLIAFLLAAITVITFGQVVARYVFNYSFVWALELSTYLFGALIFLGISYGVRVNAHIGVDALVKILPTKMAHRVGILATLLCLAYTVIIFIGSWVYVDKMVEIGILAQDMPIPQWVPRMVMPVGFALLFYRFSQVLYRMLAGKETHLVGDEVEDALKYRSDTDTAASSAQSKS
ncbi:MAG: TRAP transporter small permease [Burkholderiaceae bacterium]